MERNYADDVKINKYKLPEECEVYAGKYHYWADKLAEAKGNEDNAKDKLNLTLAEEEMSIRTTWDSIYSEQYGKMTEAAIKAVLEMNEKVKGAKSKFREAEKEVYTLEVGVKSLEHLRPMLDNLTQLLIKGFYATPNGGRREGATEQVGNDQRKGLNKK